ncbi:winged helix DNA-binding domain-containing protein [Aquihabitans daechungensis]|uniref:winged helix DNA-binding domain-containing protein n=1 Tax=Aquihabitans daechungensis TaxID=1052257 RepID=UPI003B9E9B3F
MLGHARAIAARRTSSASDRALRAARLGSQLLTDRAATTPEAVVDQLLAVQAQDPRAARLSVRSRSTGITAGEIDAALTDRRTLVVGSLLRTTLHLVAAEDFWWLHALLTPRMVTHSRTRLGQEGVSEAQAKRGVAIIAEAVRSGPHTRDQLKDLLDAADVPTARQALVHVQHAAAIEGHLVRGPMVDGQHAFVHAPTWLGDPPEEDRSVQLARLAERYLRGHGPADAADLVKWTGLALGECRTAFAAIEDRTEPFGDDGLVQLADQPLTTELPAPRLLGGFDPILHGWSSRKAFVPSDDGIVTSNGIFRPTALVDGQGVATWTMPKGQITLKPIAKITKQAMAELETEAADIARFLGLPPKPLAVGG